MHQNIVGTRDFSWWNRLEVILKEFWSALPNWGQNIPACVGAKGYHHIIHYSLFIIHHHHHHHHHHGGRNKSQRTKSQRTKSQMICWDFVRLIIIINHHHHHHLPLLAWPHLPFSQNLSRIQNMIFFPILKDENVGPHNSSKSKVKVSFR